MIPLAVPNLTGKEGEYVAEAIASGWVGPEGPFVERFEGMVREVSGRRWAIATITGSAALHASATALGFAGDCVVVMRKSFPAARNVFRSLGCDVVFSEGGENHDIAAYSPGTMKWPVLVDAAPAIGNKPIGTVECYSFAANKTVTCGHGGAVVGDDPSLEGRVTMLINNRTGKYNYRMANINAAIGCAQMERLEEFREIKRNIWQRYADAGLPMIDRGPSRWMSTIEQPKVFFIGGFRHRLEGVGGFRHRLEADWGISLPCSTSLTRDDQDKVIKACEESLR